MWRLLLTDLSGNTVAAYTDFVDFEYQRRRNFPSRLSWAVASPLRSADREVLDVDNSEQLVCKLYDDDVLVFCGVAQPVADKTVDNVGKVSATVEAYDPLERLGKRLVGVSDDGLVYDVATERREIVGDIIDALNATGYSCLLEPPPSTVSVGSCTTEIYRYKPALEVVNELSATLDGFDFWVDPSEPTVDSEGLKLGQLMMATAAGANQKNVFFEHLTGKHNVQKWSTRVLPVSNNHYALPAGFPSSVEDVVSSIDTGSAALYGLRQQVIPADIAGEQLRGYLTYLHTAIRSTPVEQYTFELSENQQSVRYLTDYEVGDIVNVRLSDDQGLAVDGQVRVYGYTLKVDGKAKTSETLTVTSGDLN